MNSRKIKLQKFLFLPVIALSVTSIIFLSSCSSNGVDQKKIDSLYQKVLNNTWLGYKNEYATSIYNTERFRDVFKDQLPTKNELAEMNLKMEIFNTFANDETGEANFEVKIFDLITDKYYPPSKTKIDDDFEEVVIDFSISKFLISNLETTNKFNDAYNRLLTIKLNTFGQSIFETQNINNYFSVNPSSPNWIGNFVDPFILSSDFNIIYYDLLADDKTKEISFKVILKSNDQIKGQAKTFIVSNL